MRPATGIVCVLSIFFYLSIAAIATVDQALEVQPDIARIEADVYYLASDELEGRLAGSPGAEMAAEYISSEFSELGLLPGDSIEGDYCQDFEITTSVTPGENNHLSVTSPEGFISLGMRTDYIPVYLSADGEIEADVVFAGYGITAPEKDWDDYANLDVDGKAVLCLKGEPRMSDPDFTLGGIYPMEYSGIRYKSMNAWRHGAAALILVTGPANIPEDGQDPLIPLNQRSAYGRSEIPVIQVSQDTLAILWSTMQAPLEMYQGEMDRHLMGFGAHLEGIRISLAVDLERTTVHTCNVAGIVPGSDPELAEEYIIVGAHYDHIGWGDVNSKYEGEDRQIHNGADDNASGVSAVMELARMFAESPDKPSRSILLICFSAEELGLLGSQAYVDSPLVPMENTSLMINLDMVGRASPGDDDWPYCIVNGIASAPGLAEIVPDTTPDGVVELIKNPNPYGGGDYMPFHSAKIPFLNFFTDVHDDYHCPSDDPETLNYPGMVSIIGVVYEVTRQVADLPEILTYIEPEVSTSETDQTENGDMSFEVYFGTVPDFVHTEGGFRIADVRPGSPAEEAGLLPGDQILMLGEYEVTDIYNYTWALGQYSPGDTVDVVVLRDGEELTLSVTFIARSE